MRRLLAVVFALVGACQTVKRESVQSALMNAGLSETMSACMAHRMAQKLSLAELRRLERLNTPDHSFAGYLAAAGRVNDPYALQVLGTSAALCRTGLIH